MIGIILGLMFVIIGLVLFAVGVLFIGAKILRNPLCTFILGIVTGWFCKK